MGVGVSLFHAGFTASSSSGGKPLEALPWGSVVSLPREIVEFLLPVWVSLQAVILSAVDCSSAGFPHCPSLLAQKSTTPGTLHRLQAGFCPMLICKGCEGSASHLTMGQRGIAALVWLPCPSSWTWGIVFHMVVSLVPHFSQIKEHLKQKNLPNWFCPLK